MNKAASLLFAMFKFRLSSLVTSGVFALSVVACGPAENADVNEMIAKTQVEAAVGAMHEVRGGKGGEAALGSLMVLGASSMSMLTPKDGNEKRDAVVTKGLARMAERVQKRDSNKCKCEENKCVFNKCELDGMGVVNGSMEWSDSSLKCDYSIKLSVEEGETKVATSFATTCDLTFSETSLDGTLSSKGDVNTEFKGQKSSVAWESSFKFDKIKFDESGIKSGKAKVEATVDAGKDTLHGKSEIDFSKKS